MLYRIMNFQFVRPGVLPIHLFTRFVRFIRGKNEDYWSIYCKFLDSEYYEVKLFVFRRVRNFMKSG